ncbi:MAG: guanylate kinase [Clostridia bacterium]|nr:guanylate kinase [Clostridia bacterium]
MKQSTERGLVVIVSGPSASGKGTVVDRTMEKAGEERVNLRLSVSMTTRGIGRNEVDGESYYFVSRETFEKNIAENNLLEYNSYAGEYYGTPKSMIEEWLDDGCSVILEIDVNGAKQVLRQYPQAVTVYILPPSFRELECRLRNRNRDSEEKIRYRLAKGKDEIPEARWYDYILVNDIIEESADDLLSIIKAELNNRARIEYKIDEVLETYGEDSQNN